MKRASIETKLEQLERTLQLRDEAIVKLSQQVEDLKEADQRKKLILNQESL
jgi:hypothetical protein